MEATGMEIAAESTTTIAGIAEVTATGTTITTNAGNASKPIQPLVINEGADAVHVGAPRLAPSERIIA
jgi:hypothetical protein